MSGSAALDVAIGLAFVFVLFSLAASRINELIASALNLRHKGLQDALRALLEEKGKDGRRPSATLANGRTITADAVLDHELVQPITQAIKGSRARSMLGRMKRLRARGLAQQGISYLPSRTFSPFILDLLAPAADPLAVLDRITNPPAAAQKALEDARAHPDLAAISALEGQMPAGPEKSELQKLMTEMTGEPLVRAQAALAGLNASKPLRPALMRMI